MSPTTSPFSLSLSPLTFLPFSSLQNNFQVRWHLAHQFPTPHYSTPSNHATKTSHPLPKMSTASPSATAAGAAAVATTTSATASSSSFFHSLGLGYAIATALGLLVLLSTLLLASYICCRSPRPRGPAPDAAGSGGAVLPRVIFVAEDDDEEGASGDEESGDAGGRRQSSATSGLDQAAIESYPKFAFSGAKGEDAVCSVCLGEYREGETLRMMPDCRHYFHLPCIDAWLRLNASCPVCRSSPMPTPLSTPLSELVPLSQYAADRRSR